MFTTTQTRDDTSEVAGHRSRTECELDGPLAAATPPTNGTLSLVVFRHDDQRSDAYAKSVMGDCARWKSGQKELPPRDGQFVHGVYCSQSITSYFVFRVSVVNRGGVVIIELTRELGALPISQENLKTYTDALIDLAAGIASRA